MRSNLLEDLVVDVYKRQVHIIVAAGLPFLPVVLKLVPLDNILKWALGKIL